MLTKYHRFIILLTPSWASSLGCLSVAAIIMTVNYLKSNSGDSAIKNGISDFQSVFSPAYQHLTDGLAQNSLVSNIPLLLFWSVVGAFVYGRATRLVAAFSNMAQLQQSLFYTNVKRNNVLAILAVNFVIRLAALFSWLAYCALFLKTLLPYAVDVSRQVSGGLLLKSTLSLLGATVLLTIALQIHVIFIRLILLRVRIFSNTI